MRKLVLLLFCGLLVVNCTSSPLEKPKDLIDEDQMVAILYDLYLVNAMKSSSTPYLKEHNVTPSKYILHKYKVDSIRFSRSDRYYASDIDTYEKLYQRVTQKLQEDKAKIDALMAKEANSETNIKELKEPSQPVIKDVSKRGKSLERALFNKKGESRN